jgi:hypothetical protein
LDGSFVFIEIGGKSAWKAIDEFVGYSFDLFCLDLSQVLFLRGLFFNPTLEIAEGNFQ